MSRLVLSEKQKKKQKTKKKKKKKKVASAAVVIGALRVNNDHFQRSDHPFPASCVVLLQRKYFSVSTYCVFFFCFAMTQWHVVRYSFLKSCNVRCCVRGIENRCRCIDKSGSNCSSLR